MDLLALKKDTQAIQDGRWVAADEVPGLGDVRVKVRGAGTAVARDMFAAKQRRVDPRDKDADGRIKPQVFVGLLREMVVEHHLVEFEGLTMGGRPVSVEDAKKLVLLPEYEPLADLCMAAVTAVDGTRESRAKDLAGN